MTWRRIRRHVISLSGSMICSFLAVMLVACAPLHLQGSDAPVPPAICSTVDPSAPTPTWPAAYAGATVMGGTIAPPPRRQLRVVATASGGGATLSIGVPDGPLLVGGAIGVDLITRNDSPDPMEVTEPRVGIEDEAGQGPTLHGFLPGVWPGSEPAPLPQQILPGQKLDGIINVQLPNADDLKGYAYNLVARTQVSSPSHPNPNGSSTPLQATSPALALVQPSAAQQLHTELYPVKAGWCLHSPGRRRITTYVAAHGVDLR